MYENNEKNKKNKKNTVPHCLQFKNAPHFQILIDFYSIIMDFKILSDQIEKPQRQLKFFFDFSILQIIIFNEIIISYNHLS